MAEVGWYVWVGAAAVVIALILVFRQVQAERQDIAVGRDARRTFVAGSRNIVIGGLDLAVFLFIVGVVGFGFYEHWREGQKQEAAEGAAANREAAEAARHLGALAYLHDTAKSLAAYREAARLDPDDVWTWIFIGRLEVRAGRLGTAERAFDEARARAEAAGAERDVMAADIELGDVARAKGNLAVARGRYEDGMRVAETLAAADPGNSDWQRDLIVSNVKLAAPAEAAEPERAREHYAEALRIARALEESGRLAPVDSGMVEELKRRLVALRE
jgi:tetratricopeptide (TPR) repeat protein